MIRIWTDAWQFGNDGNPLDRGNLLQRNLPINLGNSWSFTLRS